MNTKLKSILIISILALTIIILYFLFQSKGKHLNEDIKTSERTGYIKQYGSSDKGLTYINAYMENVSPTTTYKDFEIEVNFYSQTNTLLETKKHILYRELKPHGSLKMHDYLKDKAPANATTVKWNILDAVEVK